MTKETRSAEELEALIMAEVAKAPDCQGCTGVTIIPLDDPRCAATWSVGETHNAGAMCKDQIEQIALLLMGLYDLKRG
jgi:hypothetical protein